MDSLDRANAREQQAAVEALTWWLEGTPFETIAERQNTTRQQAVARVQASMRLREAELDQLGRYARIAIGERIERLLQTWMPRALGTTEPAELAAAKYVLTLMREQAEITGAAPAHRVDMNVHQTSDQDRTIDALVKTIEDNARADAMKQLGRTNTTEPEPGS